MVPPSSGSAVIPFGAWREVCLQAGVANDDQRQELRAEAKRLFTSLAESTQILSPGNVVLKTKSSHNEALAKLIQELGPAFTATHVGRVWALSCLCGAVEGCQTGGISLKICNMLRNFLLEHCGPMNEEDDGGEDNDELVRDSAVLCLAALARASQDSNDDSVDDSVRCRLHLATEGVNRRCAVPEEEMEYSHGYDDGYTGTTDIRGGLSTLPRSRRALCFNLVRGAIDGIAVLPAIESLSSSLASDLAKFASFAATCLHGESDPRCLQQLLEMLHALQSVFCPTFQALQSAAFPILSIFDAVALYYPIHFTPPPNDTNGITREGLHNALMDILVFTGFDALSSSSHDTMLNLSAGIFLERLLPTEEDDVTTRDKLEAIGDLTALLFPRDATSLVSKLEEGVMGEMSTALMTIHAEAAVNVASGGEKGTLNKALADSCRTLVSKVVEALETSNQKKLWNIFVADVVRTKSPLLSTSPQSMEGRTTVAYLACLAASGGPKSLGVCLQSCLPRLMDALDPKSEDEEKIAAAAYGLGAFFSSFRVCYERGIKLGVVWHPHPLEPFATKVARSLLQLINDESTGVGCSTSTKIAAIRAMDSVLNVTPSSLLSSSDLEVVNTFVLTLVSLVTGDDAENSDGADLDQAAAKTLGSIIARTSDDKTTGTDSSTVPSVLDENDELIHLVRDEVFPRLLIPRLLFSSQDDEHPRFSLLTLAYACEESESVSGTVMASLAKDLGEALKTSKNDGIDTSLAAARSLSFVLRYGGRNAAAAFQNVDEANSSPMDILLLLAGAGGDLASLNASRREIIQVGTSKLELPSTSEERAAISTTISNAYELLPHLLPAYMYSLSENQLEKLVTYVSDLLPPLSDQQNTRVSIALPILAEALRHGQAGAELNEIFPGMFSSLVDFAMDGRNALPRARMAASECAFTIATRYQPDSTSNNWALVALNNSILPGLVASVDVISSSMSDTVRDDGDTDLQYLSDIINLTAFFGAAAGCQGKSSTKNSDAVADFLVRLSCSGEAQLPCDFGPKRLVLPKNGEGCIERLQVATASAFGSMMNGVGGPFWNQRLAHKASKVVLETISEGRAVHLRSPASTGQIVVLCYIVCSAKVTALSRTAIDKIAYEILRALSGGFPSRSKEGFISVDSEQSLSLKELLLAAFVKLMAVTPQSTVGLIPVAVPTLLTVFSTCTMVEKEKELRCKFLVLQGLVNAVQSEEARRSLLAVKPAVDSILSQSLDHPSYALRRAVAYTINVWSIMN